MYNGSEYHKSLGRERMRINNLQIHPCQFCNRLLNKPNIIKHENKCLSNPLNIHKCLNCGGQTHTKFCSHSCAAQFNNKQRIKLSECMKNKSQYKEQSKFKFKLGNFPSEFDFTLLEQFGMYHPIHNPFGISRDHMFSVIEGFKQQIDPYFISHPANCKLILQSENSKKSHNSSISIYELFERINDWNSRYPNI